MDAVNPLDPNLAVPLDSPLYERPPGGWTYLAAEFTAVTFETDPSAVDRLLPPGLRPGHLPPRVTFLLLESRESSFGAYDELKVEIAVELDGEPGRYCPYIVVSALDGVLAPDAAIAMGREVMGVPKKVARIGVNREAGRTNVTIERPMGNRLCDLTFNWSETTSPELAGLTNSRPALHLRHVPSVDGGPPSISELVQWDTEKTVHPGTVRSGDCAVNYGPLSSEDPWRRLTFERLVQAVTWRGDLTIPPTASIRRNYRIDGR